MRFNRSSYVVVLLWFVAPGVLGGFLAWIFGGALFEVLRRRLPRTFALVRLALPVAALVGSAIVGSELGKLFGEPAMLVADAPEPGYVLARFAPLMSAALGVSVGLLIALYEMTPTANSPSGELLPSRSARTVIRHFGLFLAVAVAIGFAFARLR